MVTTMKSRSISLRAQRSWGPPFFLSAPQHPSALLSEVERRPPSTRLLQAEPAAPVMPTNGEFIMANTWWTVGTIARQLHIHHSVQRRVLAQAGLPRIGRPLQPVSM